MVSVFLVVNCLGDCVGVGRDGVVVCQNLEKCFLGTPYTKFCFHFFREKNTKIRKIQLGIVGNLKRIATLVTAGHTDKYDLSPMDFCINK